MPTHSEPVEGVQQAFAKDILQGLNNKKFLFIIADPNQEDCPITFVSEAFSSFTGATRFLCLVLWVSQCSDLVIGVLGGGRYPCLLLFQIGLIAHLQSLFSFTRKLKVLF